MVITTDDLRQQIISDFLLELDEFERTAERTMDKDQLDPIEAKLKQLIQQLNELAIKSNREENKPL